MILNRNIKILLYSSNIWYLGQGMLGPLLAVFTEKVGGDILDISWIWATYLIVSGICYIVVGKVVDVKYDKAKVMVFGYALNALFTFSYLLVSSTWHLFVVQIGLGIAAALATPTWNALYSEYEDKGHNTFEWGLADGEAEIITGVAVVIGGLMISYWSYEALFITMGIIQVIATIYQAQILKKRET